jgi:hypothetical protein
LRVGVGAVLQKQLHKLLADCGDIRWHCICKLNVLELRQHAATRGVFPSPRFKLAPPSTANMVKQNSSLSQ